MEVIIFPVGRIRKNSGCPPMSQLTAEMPVYCPPQRNQFTDYHWRTFEELSWPADLNDCCTE
jgi:hypothetical protein